MSCTPYSNNNTQGENNILLIKLKLVHVVEKGRAEQFIMIFFTFSVILIQSSSVETVMPEYLPVIRAVSRNDAIENYFTLGFTSSEILSFLLLRRKLRISEPVTLKCPWNSAQSQAAKKNS